MRRLTTVWLFAFVLFGCCGSQYSYSQTQEGEGVNAGARSPGQHSTLHAYRVDFRINEFQDGKSVNSRQYSIDLNSGDRHELKIGTRVPVVSGSSGGNNPLATQWQYLDVGTNIRCALREEGDATALEVHGDFSNLSTANEQQSPKSVSNLQQPIVRQVSINGSTLAALGKAIIIGSVDDPNSNRRYQLEATVTRLK